MHIVGKIWAAFALPLYYSMLYGYILRVKVSLIQSVFEYVERNFETIQSLEDSCGTMVAFPKVLFPILSGEITDPENAYSDPTGFFAAFFCQAIAADAASYRRWRLCEAGKPYLIDGRVEYWECLLYTQVAAQSPEQYQQLLLNLSVDKVLEDDVEPQWHALFGALEFLELPEQVHELPDSRLLAWALQSASSPERFIAALHATGAIVLGALEAFEDGGYCLVDSRTGARTNTCFEGQVFFNPDRVARILAAPPSS